MIKTILSLLSLIGISFLLSACSTTTNIKIPEGTQLYIAGSSTPTNISENGDVTTTPYFWTRAGSPPNGGIPFVLKQGNKVVQKGHFLSEFQTMSIFWPPLSFLFVPMGFHDNVSYDLTNDTEIINGQKTITVNFLK